MNRITALMGKDLIKWTNRAIHRLFIFSHLAQEIHPVTGTTWLYKEPGIANSFQPWPVDKLLEELKRTIQPILGIASNVGGYLLKVQDQNAIDDGLAKYKNVLRSDITGDIQTASNARTALFANKNLIADKTKLSILGEASLTPSWRIDKIINIASVDTTESEFHANCSHVVIDSLSYELRGRDEATGEPVIFDDATIRTLIVERMRAAKIEAQASGHPDAPMLLSIISWIESHRNDDVLLLANYIDSNLPKLPLVRRAWAL